MTRLYNPRNGAEFETASDDELHVKVYLDAGFEVAPEPEATPRGIAPEPVTYAPVEKKPAAKTSKATKSTDE